MFIHEAPIFLLALPGLSAGCGTHTPGWSSGAEASATQAHKKMKTQLSWRGKKKRLNDSFTSFNMAGNKLADWWQYVTSDWCSRRFSCLWRDLGKMFSRKEVGWFRVLSWRNSLGWKKFGSHCTACKFQRQCSLEIFSFRLSFTTDMLPAQLFLKLIWVFWTIDCHDSGKLFFLGKMEVIKGIIESKRQIQYFVSGCLLVGDLLFLLPKHEVFIFFLNRTMLFINRKKGRLFVIPWWDKPWIGFCRALQIFCEIEILINHQFIRSHKYHKFASSLNKRKKRILRIIFGSGPQKQGFKYLLQCVV